MGQAYDRYVEAKALAMKRRDTALREYRRAVERAENEAERQFADVIRNANAAHTEECETAYAAYLAEYDCEKTPN